MHFVIRNNLSLSIPDYNLRERQSQFVEDKLQAIMLHANPFGVANFVGACHNGRSLFQGIPASDELVWLDQIRS